MGAGPLTDDIDDARALEDQGAAAVVLRSMFEEEITGEQMSAFFSSESHDESFAEATSFSPDPEFAFGPEEYLEHLRRVKEALAIPVMASLNGSTIGGWTSYAQLLEEAGADAVELHLYHAASDFGLSVGGRKTDDPDRLAMLRKGLLVAVAIAVLHCFRTLWRPARCGGRMDWWSSPIPQSRY